MARSRMLSLALGAALALAFVGCATDSSTGDETGSLNLTLELADGITINEVDWTIAGGDMEPMSGTIDTSAPGSTASVEVFGLPPTLGPDYTIVMMAVSEDGGTTCRGSEDFGVDIGEATEIMVFLNCKRPTTLGGVRVNGKVNICAQLQKAVASPLQTSVGNDIDLSAIGEDLEGDDIAYLWTATGGDVDDNAAQLTSYTCDEVGDHAITITVSDDGFGHCMDDWTFPVTCVEGDGLECVEDGDCDEDEVCVENECVPDLECIEDGDCDEDEVCVENECVPDLECIEDEDCGEDEVCVENECVPDLECIEDGDCEEDEVCVENECVPDLECIEDGDCGSGEVCVENECVPDLECIEDDDCDEDEVCVENECVLDVECNESSDCDAGQICVGNACVGDPDLFCTEGVCAIDEQARLDCVDAFLVCLAEEPINEEECVLLAVLECNECNENSDCDEGELCEENACVPDVEYAQDFESLDPGDPDALENDGWLYFGNVFDGTGAFKFGFGPFAAPTTSGQISGIVSGEGGPDQGLQQLVVFSNYDCCQPGEGHFNGTDLVETIVFQEINPIPADFIGQLFEFTFDAKRGNIGGSTTAQAFIRTLDPGAGFATTNNVVLDTTSLPMSWGPYSVMLNLSDPMLQGQILQFGFSTIAKDFEDAGNFYDNNVATLSPVP